MARTWLITGCSEGGIGAAIARTVLEAGENVAVTARNTDKVQRIVSDFPDTAFSVALDVTDNDSIHTAVEQIMARFGKIDVLVNNAGYFYRVSYKDTACQNIRKTQSTRPTSRAIR